MKKFTKKIKHIFEYAFFLLFSQFLLLLGFKRATCFCSFFAKKIGPRLRVSDIARKNIAMTIGDTNIEQIIDGLWNNYGRYIAEFVYVNKLSKQELDKMIVAGGVVFPEVTQLGEEEDKPKIDVAIEKITKTVSKQTELLKDVNKKLEKAFELLARN